jgi:hypothetical protein
MYSEDGIDWKVAKRFVKRERNVEMKLQQFHRLAA